MSWSQVGNGGPTRYVKPASCEKGSIVVEGWFTGTEQGKFSPVHYFRTAENERVGVNSTRQLAWILSQVEAGEYVRVIYDGKDKLTKGAFAGKEAHHFSALKDPSRKGLAPEWVSSGAVSNTDTPDTDGNTSGDDPLA